MVGNIITIELLEEDYALIPKEVRERVTIKVIEPKDFDYSDSDAWRELKKKSNKAYEELKKIEFELRQSKK